MRLPFILSAVIATSLFGVATLLGQQTMVSPDKIWQDVSLVQQNVSLGQQKDAGAGPMGAIRSYRLVRVNQAMLQASLSHAPDEATVRAHQSSAVITLPMPDGSFQHFSFVESPVMHPKLAAKYPQIKTYLGQGIDDPYATIRFDSTPAGFHAQVLRPDGAVYVEPFDKQDTGLCASYYKRDNLHVSDFECLTEGTSPVNVEAAAVTLSSTTVYLRTFRLAMAASGSFTQYHGGTVELGLAAVVTGVNRVTGIYENELAVRLELVANNDLIIFTDPGTDGYTNGNRSEMLDENQSKIDSVIGSGNYDIGHVVDGTGGGGLAELGCLCEGGDKARGATSSGEPTGDDFWVDFVAHEIGHQFGADHTFNGIRGNCGGNRVEESAYEIGSGSTIMCYAGICGEDDLQPHSDPYFHHRSWVQMITTVVDTSCYTVDPAGNNFPQFLYSLGGWCTIPYMTPFELRVPEAQCSDPDGDPLTFCWEQYDLGWSQPAIGPGSGDVGDGPIFRSFPPTSDRARIFPQLTDVLAGQVSIGEWYPATNRYLSFMVTARDNRAGGGGLSFSYVDQIQVTTSAGPFRVTNPNAAVVWQAGIPRLVQWSVAGTNTSAIDPVVTNVDILLSKDGGYTFPITLASDTPNDGEESVTIPISDLTQQARIKIQPVNHIFFAISGSNFRVVCPIAGRPENTSASQGTRTDAIELSWSSPTTSPGGVQSFEIWRNTTADRNTASILQSNWTTTGYIDSTVGAGATYYYWIRAVNFCGMSGDFTPAFSGWRKLAAPTGVIATDGTETAHVRIGWGAAPGVDSFKVYRNTVNDLASATVLVPSTAMLYHEDVTAAPCVTYYYWVQAFNSSVEYGESVISDSDSGWRALNPPSNFIGSHGTQASHVALQWNPAPSATHYRVYRGTEYDPALATPLTFWTTATSYDDFGATPGRRLLLLVQGGDQ